MTYEACFGKYNFSKLFAHYVYKALWRIGFLHFPTNGLPNSVNTYEYCMHVFMFKTSRNNNDNELMTNGIY